MSCPAHSAIFWNVQPYIIKHGKKQQMGEQGSEWLKLVSSGQCIFTIPKYIHQITEPHSLTAVDINIYISVSKYWCVQLYEVWQLRIIFKGDTLNAGTSKGMSYLGTQKVCDCKLFFRFPFPTKYLERHMKHPAMLQGYVWWGLVPPWGITASNASLQEMQQYCYKSLET